MKTLRGLAIAGGLVLSACGMGSTYPDFTHTPSFRIEGVRTPVGGGAAQQVLIYRDGAKLRVETLVPGRGRSVVVFDTGTNDAYALTSLPVIAPVVVGAAGVVTSPPAPPITTALPIAPPPNALGMAVRVGDSEAPQPLETPWAALGAANAAAVGGCRVADERGREWRATSTSLGDAERTACITPDGIVLRVRERNQTIFEAHRLTRGPVSPSLFGVPPGFQRANPNAVAETPATPTSVVANTGPAG